ncbi:hypothetical protein [Sulfitobacter pontiacus]|uniref:hypothetical protein n=1 Tax=Sulfitobacter pontiacus TaxID=60137 RepID=UPI0021A74BB1|nr:hypothetical protein [Sulfitobacter pontiacus]UWR17510.1 hypothetical protein K3755_07235 [Sulfitobacter pontiacus]
MPEQNARLQSPGYFFAWQRHQVMRGALMRTFPKFKEMKMKRAFMCGLAAIVGLVTMVGAAMAHHADVDVMIELQPDVGVYEMSMFHDVDVLAHVDVAPDGLNTVAFKAVPAKSLEEPMATRGAASSTMVDDAMRLWRARTSAVFTTSPDLLI